MRSLLLAGAIGLVAGCAYPDAQVRNHAATDFRCPEDEIVVHELSSGYLARGCMKEATYRVQGDRVTRETQVTRATVNERPELPIDRIPGTDSIGLD